MKIGQLVRWPRSTQKSMPAMIGVIKAITPHEDDITYQIFWVAGNESIDKCPPNEKNSDFEVTNFKDADVKAFIDELSRTQRDMLMRMAI